jgi:hypothetical protein
MKFLRNPFVSGALALVAVLVVVYQIGKPLAQRYWARNVRAPAVATVTKALESAVTKAATGQPALGSSSVSILSAAPRDPIDTAAVAEKVGVWVEAPSRDPFRVLPPPMESGGNTNAIRSPLENWMLKAIWRQTGGRVAAINDGVYGEGDLIEGFKVLRVEGDVVWLEGTNRIYHLRFPTWETVGTNRVTTPRR